MRKLISLSLVMLATPANAHCYSVWHYKTPQHCHAGTVSKNIKLIRPNVVKFHEPETKLETRELHVSNEDIERAIGIKKLKEIMK